MRVRACMAASVLVFATFVAPAQSQQSGNTILVLDGSGSMWGQIDGTAKITIAQDVVAELLETLPGDTELGLTVYGHRERGNCADIETIATPGGATRDQIARAVNGIKPKGKTPMTDAVLQAAEALRYTEEKATVILVSDGIETCHPDPCAAARAMEEAGIDFTAHVIGFDITDPEALRQMQCLADGTGGTFNTADTAAELTTALTTVAAAPPPEPEPEPLPVAIGLHAVIGSQDGQLIDAPVLWDITNDSGVVLNAPATNPAELSLPAGSYEVTATWTAQGLTQTRQFIAADTPRQVFVVFEAPQPSATIIAPSQAPMGATIEVGWTGPAGPDDFIGVGLEAATGAERWRNFAMLDDTVVDLLLPPETGPAVIGYFDGDTREMLGSAAIALTPLDIALSAPASALAGSDISVGWTGPDYADDFIGVGRADAAGADRWESWAYTAGASPVRFTLPAQPGDYVLTYFLGQDNTPSQSVALTVTEVQATLSAPAEAVAGSIIDVDWTGPAYKGDYIGIGAPDATGSGQWETFAYVQEGSPVQIEMPTTPGAYRISYFIGADRSVLTSVALMVTEAGAQVSAPASAPAGSSIDVAWQGPDYPNDYIGVGRADATGSGQWKTFTYTRDGNPLRVRVPIEPGDYLIRYFLNQDRTEIASAPLTVTPLDVNLAGPASSEAGATIEVTWQGPGYPDDYIGIGAEGATGSGQWQTFSYVRDGSPLRIRVPTEPGTYRITYFANQERTALAATDLRVTAVNASVLAPSSAQAGQEIDVGWTGPGYDGDFIGIGLAGATSSGQWKSYAALSKGNPVRLALPDTPGEYVIKYFLDQGNTPVAETAITLN